MKAGQSKSERLIAGATASYRLIASVPPVNRLDTSVLFHTDTPIVRSPIDAFIANTNVLNTIYLPYGDSGKTWVPELGSLIVLGYMSAVESYIRALITGLINIDEFCRKQAGEKQVSFALVTGGHDPRLLPEALLENVAFSSEEEIEKVLKSFVGIKKDFPVEVQAAVIEYRKLCQVRHCCVHRFGKLGSRNALILGFESHRHVIEHPFSPKIADIDGIADSLQGFVKTLNNFIFREVLERTARPDYPGLQWAWHYGRDKKRFATYYDLFAIKNSIPASSSQADVYQSFKEVGLKARAGRARRDAAEAG